MTETGEQSDKKQGTVCETIATVLAVLLTLVAIYWSADKFRSAGLLIDTRQYLGVILALALPIIYLSRRISKKSARRNPPWYDIVAAIIGFFAASYIAVRFPVLNELQFQRPVDGLICAGVILVLIFEGLRRTVGLVLPVVVIVFFLLPLVGPYLPGEFAVPAYSFEKLVYTIGWDPNAILGVPMIVVSTIVVTFVFFGQILLRSGGSEFFTEISMALVGRYRGGQAKIAITASALFGSISGSAVSNVATTGVITIPLMRKGGYSPYHAGAIEAVASTGGQLMPPIMGAAAFLMAEFLEVPYTEVVIAAVTPAIMYYIALFILADLEPARAGIKPLDKKDIPRLGAVFRDGWYFPLPFVILVVSLFVLNYSPEKSALISAVGMILLSLIFGFRGRRMGPKGLYEAVRATGFAVLDIIMIGAAAGVVIGALSVTGIGFQLTKILVSLGGGNLYLLLVVAAFICILLGMGMPTAGVYILLSALVGPALVGVGIEDMAAHLFILYFGMMSMITPPVAIAAFAAASLTGADAMKTGFAAVRFGWVAYLLPFIFVTSPSLLLRGEPWVIAVDIATAVLAIWLVSIAIIGFFTRNLSLPERILFAVVGLALFIPVQAFSHALWATLVAGAIGLFLLGRERFAVSRAD
ncbi:MAG: TRAP transporter fused permease subunit [Alphaproteobacteria bacterium]|nr:TRAP transporter fused permease subunit [Alphaproteobacteria bacterium]